MAKNFWPRLLLRQSPNSGRIIRESAEHYNAADHLADMRRINCILEVEEGRVFHAGWRGLIGKSTSIYFDQPIIPGKKIRGLSLSAILSGGFIELTQFVRAEAGSILEVLPGNNVNSRSLNRASENPFNRVSGLTGGTTIDRAFSTSPATGVNTAVAAISASGAGGIYDNENTTSFSAQNTSTTVDSEVVFNMIWVEEDINS
jgi:hypothetical protein